MRSVERPLDPGTPPAFWHGIQKAAEQEVAENSARLFRAQVVSVSTAGPLGEQKADVRREYMAQPDGIPYPVVATGYPLKAGDWAWCVQRQGGIVVLGRNLSAADKGVAEALADAKAYTDDRIKRITPTDALAASAPPSAWDPQNLANYKAYAMLGTAAGGGWPGTGTVLTESAVAVPTGSGNAGFAVQRFTFSNNNRTLWRSGTNTDGWTAWAEYSVTGHNHDGVYSPVNHEHPWGSWNALPVPAGWSETFFGVRRHAITDMIAFRGRIVPPSGGWTPGVTLLTLATHLRPEGYGRAAMCAGTGGISVMVAVETDGRFRVWESSNGAVPGSIDVSALSFSGQTL